MENLADLMQRLLEIQSGGRQRNPQLIAEEELLVDGFTKAKFRRRKVPCSPNQPINPRISLGGYAKVGLVQSL
jgi:hypothetical protein